jgi:hypothetical protein
MWEKLKFQVPGFLIGSCHGMWTRIIMEQRTPLDSKYLHLLRIATFSFVVGISGVTMSSDHKKTGSHLAIMHQCNSKPDTDL